jgi:amidophosphoribosyltransferase
MKKRIPGRRVGFSDKCGVFGISGHREASKIAYLGLHALQHRGQESAGIAVSNGRLIRTYKQMGLVGDVFDEAVLEKLEGSRAIGHVRYSTAGDSSIRNAQPIGAEYAKGSIAVCHNGTLTNFSELKSSLEKEGSIFGTGSDTECFIHLIARSGRGRVVDRIIEALGQVEGAYSLLFLTEQALIAVRDPFGIRPLVLGKLGRSAMVSSESTSFDLVSGRLLRDLSPGEVLVVENGAARMKSLFPFDKRQRHLCIFEFIYFARPDSIIEGLSVHNVRKALGRQLAIEQPVDADIVIPVPDSGTPAAMGYSEASGIPFELGFIRSHYVGRTFIEPRQTIRNFGVKLKLGTIREVFKGKRVVVVDDSIVRGTTSAKIVKMVRAAGARQVHVRISSPPTRYSCHYGIDTPTRKELIAAFSEVGKIEDYLTADSLGYLSLEGCLQSVGSREGFCHACFSGSYPVPVKPGPKVRQARLIMGNDMRDMF